MAGLPNNEAGASFAGVYELRLRTSSPTAGVSTEYAAAYVKVSGTTWTLTTSPVLGDSVVVVPESAVATTVAATWPSTLTYGTAASVPVTVTAASGAAKPSGAVRLVSGATTLGTANLSAAGTASFPLSETALVPGSQALQVVYAGVADAFSRRRSRPPRRSSWPRRPRGAGAQGEEGADAPRRAAPPPSRSRPPAVWPRPAATAQVVLKKGKTTKKVTVTIKAGTGTVKLPKLPAGHLVGDGDLRGRRPLHDGEVEDRQGQGEEPGSEVAAHRDAWCRRSAAGTTPARRSVQSGEQETRVR